ncbi:tyrosine--tRNA ligase [Propioniciclava sp. MC1595]|uniref:tyrosine--tRNA ligase n=1 Tax=Propioniciclava sp. MC1595 TaxID=2760308 RepID=UPI00166229B3|nr:tyrosine--tRNA ligase [Propioniciclava sp. MC1595]MBB1496259.1 tyrosine--tRNA ligase [Propioniciclava sp. MC1595]NLE18651.1 tyrosine--tRNA ligase [Propioniciclava sp.]QTE24849.1 tyrosine--tRNA ligase [Propioniciclava sp. MC1595]
MNALIDELSWRGLIAHSTDLDALGAHLDEGPITAYVGFDPTAPSIHMGNLVQVMVHRALQKAGHRPMFLVGGSTGLIGDPKQAGERVMNDVDVVAGWVERIRSQVGRLIDLEGPNAGTLVNNLDWTAKLSTLDFLRDVGKHFSVNRMLDREVVKARLETGISYTEFSYVLLQSLDFRELYRSHGVTMQTGGSDQWGNLTAGVDLIRRSDGGRVHALATPLLTKADGTKFGKTESGTVWLDPEMTSPYAFHQYFLNAEDEMVVAYLKVFSERPRDEIDDIAAQQAEKPFLRIAQRALADDITDLVHGEPERRAAEAAAAALFGRSELRDLDARTLAAVAKQLEAPRLEAGETLPALVDVLAASGVVPSKSAGRRAIEEGGAYLNNVKVTDVDAVLTQDDLLDGRWAVVRRGKKTVGAVEVVR